MVDRSEPFQAEGTPFIENAEQGKKQKKFRYLRATQIISEPNYFGLYDKSNHVDLRFRQLFSTFKTQVAEPDLTKILSKLEVFLYKAIFNIMRRKPKIEFSTLKRETSISIIQYVVADLAFSNQPFLPYLYPLIDQYVALSIDTNHDFLNFDLKSALLPEQWDNLTRDEIIFLNSCQATYKVNSQSDSKGHLRPGGSIYLGRTSSQNVLEFSLRTEDSSKLGEVNGQHSSVYSSKEGHNCYKKCIVDSSVSVVEMKSYIQEMRLFSLLSSVLSRSFKSEEQVENLLNHYFVLSKSSMCFPTQKNLILVMEQDECDQGNLKYATQSGHFQFSAFSAIKLFVAIAFLHSMNCVHLDLKPENILVHKETVKVADFGSAKLCKISEATELLSDTLVSTLGYAVHPKDIEDIKKLDLFGQDFTVYYKKIDARSLAILLIITFFNQNQRWKEELLGVEITVYSNVLSNGNFLELNKQIKKINNRERHTFYSDFEVGISGNGQEPEIPCSMIDVLAMMLRPIRERITVFQALNYIRTLSDNDEGLNMKDCFDEHCSALEFINNSRLET